MKYKTTAFLSLVLTLGLFVGSAHSQRLLAQTPSDEAEQHGLKQPADTLLYKERDHLKIDDLKLWIYLALTAGTGAIGGLVYYLMHFKDIQEILDEEAKLREMKGCLPENRNLANWMCCISKMSIGAASAPAALMLLHPESAFALIATSVVVGSAGSAVLRNVQAAMMTTVAKTKAENEAKHRRNLIGKQSDKIGQLIELVENGAGNPQDWSKVRAIAEALKANCQACSATFGSVLSRSTTPGTNSDAVSVLSESTIPGASFNTETKNLKEEALNGHG